MEESKRSSPRRTQLKRVRRRLVKNSWNMLAEKNFKALDIMKRMKTMKLMERKKQDDEKRKQKILEKERKRELKMKEKLTKHFEKTYKKIKQTLDVNSHRIKRSFDDDYGEDMENLTFTGKDAQNKELVMALLKKKGRKPRGFY